MTALRNQLTTIVDEISIIGDSVPQRVDDHLSSADVSANG